MNGGQSSLQTVEEWLKTHGLAETLAVEAWQQLQAILRQSKSRSNLHPPPQSKLILAAKVIATHLSSKNSVLSADKWITAAECAVILVEDCHGAQQWWPELQSLNAQAFQTLSRHITASDPTRPSKALCATALRLILSILLRLNSDFDFASAVSKSSEKRSYVQGVYQQVAEFFPVSLSLLCESEQLAAPISTLLSRLLLSLVDSLRTLILRADSKNEASTTTAATAATTVVTAAGTSFSSPYFSSSVSAQDPILCQINSLYCALCSSAEIHRFPTIVLALLKSSACLFVADALSGASPKVEFVHRDLTSHITVLLSHLLPCLPRNSWTYKYSETSLPVLVQSLVAIALLAQLHLSQLSCKLIHALSLHVEASQLAISKLAQLHRQFLSLSLIDCALCAPCSVGCAMAKGMVNALRDRESIRSTLRNHRLDLVDYPEVVLGKFRALCEKALGRFKELMGSQLREWSQAWNEVAAELGKVDGWTPSLPATNRTSLQLDLQPKAKADLDGLLSRLEKQEQQDAGAKEPKRRAGGGQYAGLCAWQEQLSELRRQKNEVMKAFRGEHQHAYRDDENDVINDSLITMGEGSTSWNDMYSHARSHAHILDATSQRKRAREDGEESRSKARADLDEQPSEHKHVVLYNIHAARPKPQPVPAKDELNITSAPRAQPEESEEARRNAFLLQLDALYKSFGTESASIVGSGISATTDFAPEVALQMSTGSICKHLLAIGLGEILNEGDTSESKDATSNSLPLCFLDENQYIHAFLPLLLEEFKGCLRACLAVQSPDETNVDSAIADYVVADRQVEEVLIENEAKREDEPSISELHLKACERDKPLDLIRDQLVLVLPLPRSQVDVKSFRSMSTRHHALALVNSASSRSAKSSVSLLCATSRILDWPRRTPWTCVSLCNLSPLLREWQALLSVRALKAMPLVPYLLSGSPVLSAQQLSTMRASLLAKMSALETAMRFQTPSARLAPLLAALLCDLQQLAEAPINIPLLKHTGIGKDVKTIARNRDGWYSPELAASASALVTSWTRMIEHNKDVITTRKGGRVVAIPAQLNHDAVVPWELWQRIEKEGFNASQLYAIQYVVEKFRSPHCGLTLIQGPPGTGKTSTILGILSALLGSSSTSSTATGSIKRILICAPSNAAIDEVLLRVHSRGLAVVSDNPELSRRPVTLLRLGESKGAAQRLTWDEQVEKIVQQDAHYALLQKVRASILELEQLLATPSAATSSRSGPHDRRPAGSHSEQQQQQQQALFELRQTRARSEAALDRVRSEARVQTLRNAEVVFATLNSSNKQTFLDAVMQEKLLFDTVIIDEAAQTTEVSSLLPLRMGCRRLVLIGDPRQLPATVLSRRAQLAGLGRSLFERLEALGHEVVMLSVQYRMHPCIRQFPSDYFYDSLLCDAPGIVDEVQRDASTGHVSSAFLRSLGVHPVMFFQSRARESKAGTSFINPDEAKRVMRVLRGLVAHRVHENLSVAIITPYKAQVRWLQRKLREDDRLSARAVAEAVEVNTIDGFQGRERDIVLFSTVRSGEGRHSIGFVADERRLNVAITRARKALLVFGNEDTLRVDTSWSEMLKHLHRSGEVHDELPARLVCN